MLKDLRDIRAKDIKAKIEKYNRICTSLTEIEKSIKEYENQPVVEQKEFSFWKKVFKTKEYEDYLKQVQQDRRLMKRYQQIKLKEQKAELQKEIDGLDIEELKKSYEKISFAQNLDDLQLSLEEGLQILEDNKINFVLDSSDKVPISKPYKEVNDISEYVLIYKSSYAPKNGVIETPKKLGDTEVNEIVINGETYNYEYEKALDSISFTINDEKIYKSQKENQEKKYAIIIKLQDIDKDKIRVLSPVNTIIDGDLEIPDGSSIICPKAEVDTLADENPELNVIGYSGNDVNGYARSFISMLGYRIEKLDLWSWVNPLAQEDFINVTSNLGFNIDNKTVNLIENEYILLNISKYIGILNTIKENNILKENDSEEILHELIKQDILHLTPTEAILKELLAEQYKGLMLLYEKLDENGYTIKEEFKDIISNIVTILAYEKLTTELVFGKDFKTKTSNKKFVTFLTDEINDYDEKLTLPYQLVGIAITYLCLEAINLNK